METKFFGKNQIADAAKILKSGGIVAIPTETVYGLAASAYNIKAIENIFKAKGRPLDNPLIVHISSPEEIYGVVSEFSEPAKKLTKKFWPGPLTVILPKNKDIPLEVTGGMDSVAVRCPANVIAQKVISMAGVPLVAPSANISGKPSPTKFEHVVADLNGKIDAVIDGGDCEIGLESTVVSFISNVPKILRPGRVSAEEIKKIIGEVEVDKFVYEKFQKDQKVLSPGMKYKHYSPQTPVTVVTGSSEKYAEFVNSNMGQNVAALCFDEDIPFVKVPYISYGSISATSDQACNLFGALRKCDELNSSKIYAHYVKCDEMSLAIYNRLIRAAGFSIIEL